MKTQRQCPGCGAVLQSDHPDALGYLPRHVLKSEQDELICQRCYRIRHYGKNQAYTDQWDAEQVVLEGLKWAQGIVVILDLMDFEASIPRNIRRFIHKHEAIIVLNKVDLLPPRTSVLEAKQWAEDYLHNLGIDTEVVAVSSTTGYGIESLLAKMARSTAQKWIVTGVTNAGKSSLIAKVLQHQARDTHLVPTTALFPGTTVALTRWNLDHGLVLSDSPGLVPKGRLTDLVCPDCAVKLIPAQRLKVSLHRINQRTALVIPGLAAVQPQNNKDTVVVGFTASLVAWQRANADKISNWLAQRCGSCRFEEWTDVDVTVEPNQELYIHGLGWVSIRGHRFACKLTIPKGVDYTIRANLIGEKAVQSIRVQ